MKNIFSIDEEQKVFKTTINKETEKKKDQFINNKTILFSLYAIIICFSLYLFFFLSSF